MRSVCWRSKCCPLLVVWLDSNSSFLSIRTSLVISRLPASLLSLC
jgi:hypothetical protein